MTVTDRRLQLCEQTPIELTGIDFIRVVDHEVQDTLWVYFVVEPTNVDTPLVSSASLVPPAPGAESGPAIAAAVDVTITSVDSEQALQIIATRWRLVATPSGVRAVLEVQVDELGGFENHRLFIDDDRLDPFFNDVTFNFKQGCPSPFDCKHEIRCDDPEPTDVAIDYLARDFDSYRQALLDFAAVRYPDWRDPLEADIAVMLMEIMAVLGDEFAYLQDRYAQEATFATATQRRSRSSLARLVDYEVDTGSPGGTEVAIWVDAAIAPAGATTEAGMQVWAARDGQAPLTFTVTADEWHHPNWNEIQLHCPDNDQACLPAGSTCAYLASVGPTNAELPAGTPLSDDLFWIGRRIILRDTPADSAQPVQAAAVTITAIERFTDELILTDGNPTPVTKIYWAEDQATAHPLTLATTTALLNVSPVLAGQLEREMFRVGTDEDALARYPLLSDIDQQMLLGLPRAIERDGPYDADLGQRGAVVRYGLRATETVGLGFVGSRDPLGLGSDSAQTPRLDLFEIEPPLFTPIVGATAWAYERNLLTADLDSAIYTLEEGMWRTTVVHQTSTGTIEFGDYASDDGWTIRFGDGAFGRPPEPGTVFQANYFSAPGSQANLSAGSIQLLAPGVPAPTSQPIPHARAVTNPLAITSATDEESARSVRIRAPEAYRRRPLRAVRPEDYSEIAERLPFVQRANAVSRYTGSWSTDFVTADPLGGFELTNDHISQLAMVLDCTRQVGRDVCVAQPDYLDIDLEVTICVEAASYPGQVIPRVVRLLEPPGLFNPDNFTFGKPLRRSVIEAAVQSVPGVLAVDLIRLRVRGRTDWFEFDSAELPVAASQIIRLQNDPLLPARGSLVVLSRGRS